MSNVPFAGEEVEPGSIAALARIIGCEEALVIVNQAYEDVKEERTRLREALRTARRFVVETETDAERERRDEPLSLWRGGVLKEIDAALAATTGDKKEKNDG